MQTKENKKKMITIVILLIIGFIVLTCFLGIFHRGTVNLKQVKKGTAKVIEKSAERKEVLSIYADDMAGSFHPAYAISYGDRIAVSLVFEPLMVRNSKGQLEKNLIKSLDVAEDGLTYKIVLKDNIVFSDQTKLAVSDVFASIAAMAMSGNGGAAINAYERIAGMAEFLENPVEFPKGFVKLSETEMEIVFEEASPDNLLIMETMIQKADFSKEKTDGEVVVENLECLRNGIGTGAYCFTNTSNGSICTLEANQYFRESIGDIQRVEFSSVNYYDVPERVKSGTIDVVSCSGTSQLYEVFNEWEGFHVYRKPQETIYAIYYNQQNPVLNNLKVRQAIAYGFDRKGLEKEEISRYVAFDEGIALSTDYIKNTDSNSYSKSKAKKLLKEAADEIDGLNDEIVLSLPILRGNEIQKQLADALQKNFEEIGLKLDVCELSQQEYIQTIYLKMNFDLYLSGIAVEEQTSFYKNIYEPEGNLPIDINDSAIQKAYEELEKSYGLKEVQKAEANLCQAVIEASPMLVLGRDISYISVAADLSGFEATPYGVLLNQVHKIRVKN